jgi:hypothetical protein
MQNRMGRRALFSFVFTALSGAVMLSGCSLPRGLDHVAQRPAAQVEVPQQTQQEALLTQQILASGSGMYQGQRLTVAGEYRNALGEQCKRLAGNGAQGSIEAAMCADSSGSWRFLKPLN